MSSRKRLVEADLEEHAKRPVAEYRDGSKGVNLPFDANVYVRCWRIVEPLPDHDPKGERGNVVESQELRGHRVRLDLVGWGPAVILQLDRKNKTATVFIEDDEGREEVVQWTR